MEENANRNVLLMRTLWINLLFFKEYIYIYIYRRKGSVDKHPWNRIQIFDFIKSSSGSSAGIQVQNIMKLKTF